MILTHIASTLADPVIPTSKVGGGIQGIWDKYGIMAIVAVLVTAFIIGLWNMIKKHPVILIVIAIVGTMMFLGLKK